MKTAGVRDIIAERGEEPQFDSMTNKFVYPYNIRLQGMQTIRKHAKAKLEKQKSLRSLSRSPSRTGKSEMSGGAESSRSPSVSFRSRTGSGSGVFAEMEGSEASSLEPQPLQDERSGRMVSEEDLEAELEGDFEVRHAPAPFPAE